MCFLIFLGFLKNGVVYTIFLAIYTILKIVKALCINVYTPFTPFTPHKNADTEFYFFILQDSYIIW